jgi:hypothetical protein
VIGLGLLKNSAMKLKERIREDRIRQRVKEPLPETVLTVVAAIVQKFDLQVFSLAGEGGCARLEAEPMAEGRLGLFPLLTPGQWRLTREIVARFDNPYLIFARTPEDIYLSRELYECNPELTVKALREQSLGALWAQEGKREYNF